MLNAFLVALAVFICVGGAELIGFTMLNRPIVIGPLVGLFLGDLHTGVIIGASLEAVFMGVVNIGGASAAEPGIATAVGTAFAIMLGKGFEVALTLALPIGISFYTFQTLSYTIDVYRRKVEVQHNIIDFGMYVCLFPQLIAGPIVRYSDVAEQIRNRRGSWEERAYGAQRFIVGLAKKVLLANQIGDLWSQISVLPQSDMSMSAAWLGAIAYTFQIYFDFSGYSDMAIGLGHILGFRFPENFNYPYLSRSITEFWRRWHMTLGTWFREYVYIPLGGNRKGTIRQIFNLLVVWFLTGLWHGAGWNFILWGLYFFVLLLVEKLFLLREMGRWPKIFRHIYALFFIVLGWAVFACDDMSVLFSYLQSMFGVNVAAGNGIAAYYWQSYGWLLLIMVIGSTQLPKKAVRSVCTWLCTVTGQRFPAGGERLVYVLRAAGLAVLLLISVALLVSGSYNPFLYFRF